MFTLIICTNRTDYINQQAIALQDRRLHLTPTGDSYGALRYRTLSISHAAFASGMNISTDSNGTDILSSSVRSINPNSSRRFTSVCTFE